MQPVGVKSTFYMDNYFENHPHKPLPTIIFQRDVISTAELIYLLGRNSTVTGNLIIRGTEEAIDTPELPENIQILNQLLLENIHTLHIPDSWEFRDIIVDDYTLNSINNQSVTLSDEGISKLRSNYNNINV